MQYVLSEGQRKDLLQDADAPHVVGTPSVGAKLGDFLLPKSGAITERYDSGSNLEGGTTHGGRSAS